MKFLCFRRKPRPVPVPVDPDPTEREAADPGPAAPVEPDPAPTFAAAVAPEPSADPPPGPETADALTDIAIRVALEYAGWGGDRYLRLLELSDLQMAGVLAELRKTLPPGAIATVAQALQEGQKWALEVSKS